MTATSPYLDQPKRSEDQAVADHERDLFEIMARRHRNTLLELSDWLRKTDAPSHYFLALEYLIGQLDKNAAARILERNKRDG